ncbi:class I adenylate-forming enzyme family protein [Trujillonella endophytica]|uniref:Long-chain acyl-CoA synthetase n=1 Tax=Trujillonella endophytica TaxID=673521 RepID=A0A1H8V272_9ACTN|nr:class I adenylate-forming enzyme family protein [Trujillella endophytica]SEP09327.1 long-chain acyl-CoA synthetase [Trujillella endophytica]
MRRPAGDGSPTVGGVLRAAASRHPDRPALVARGGTLSYADLDRRADAAAGALHALGVRPGDRVAACLPNDLDVVVAFHGSQRIGAVWAGIGEALTAAEQQALVDVCTPRVFLAGPACEVDGPAVVGLRRWRQHVAAAPAPPAVGVDPLAPAGIAFSSGTTGAPKAVVHSQANLLLPAEVLAATRGWDAGLRKGDGLPFTILNMLVLSTLAATYAGGCSIVLDTRDPGAIAAAIAAERITVWNGAPAQLFDLARRPDADLGSLTEAWTGGGTCPEHVRAAFADTHGVPVTATYGLSEAPTVVAIDPVSGDHRSAASGRVLPHLDVAAYDDGGVRLEPGATGELGLLPAPGGPWAGRWRPPLGHWADGVLRPLPAGPLMTGDVGSVDADGWLTMVDRKKLTIVRGGANVYPAEVEAVLLAHPGVAAVAVLGVPDERLGERVAALVVPAAEGVTGAALAAYCAERLARYKIPQVWARTPALPLNGMGKTVRTGLPELLDRAPRL